MRAIELAPCEQEGEAKGQEAERKAKGIAKGQALQGHIDANRETGRSVLTGMGHTV